MHEHSTPEQPKELTLEERLASGELNFLTNLEALNEYQLEVDITPIKILDGIRQKYGAENVVVSNALNSDGKPEGIQGSMGVYVTKEALEQAQSEK